MVSGRWYPLRLFTASFEAHWANAAAHRKGYHTMSYREFNDIRMRPATMVDVMSDPNRVGIYRLKRKYRGLLRSKRGKQFKTLGRKNLC